MLRATAEVGREAAWLLLPVKLSVKLLRSCLHPTQNSELKTNPMTWELLQQARVLDPVAGTDQVTDVLLEDGVISKVSNSIADFPNATIIYDCQGLILGPGLVDLYSHSGEPGFEERETLQSLSLAAAAGGFTRIAVLPDTAPALDNPASVAWLRDQAKVLSEQARTEIEPLNSSKQESGKPTRLLTTLPQLHCWGALTIEVKGQQMTELAELAIADVIGFADGKPINNLGLVRRLLEYLQPLAKPVALWACDVGLTGNGVMREGQESIRFGLPGIPTIAETTALAALLECVEAIGTPVHLMRVSTARSVDLIRAAKARGVPITASTTWMHLLLNSEDLGSYDPNLRLDPPIGNPHDQLALIDALQAGVLDAIAIDHSPYTYEEKTVAFAEAPTGAIGLELALPLLWNALVETGQWSALELWRCLSTHPAHCLQQKPGEIAPGQLAEMTLFDPQKLWTVDHSSLKSLSASTPWLGQEIKGQVVRVWCP